MRRSQLGHAGVGQPACIAHRLRVAFCCCGVGQGGSDASAAGRRVQRQERGCKRDGAWHPLHWRGGCTQSRRTCATDWHVMAPHHYIIAGQPVAGHGFGGRCATPSHAVPLPPAAARRWLGAAAPAWAARRVRGIPRSSRASSCPPGAAHCSPRARCRSGVLQGQSGVSGPPRLALPAGHAFTWMHGAAPRSRALGSNAPSRVWPCKARRRWPRAAPCRMPPSRLTRSMFGCWDCACWAHASSVSGTLPASQRSKNAWVADTRAWRWAASSGAMRLLHGYAATP